MPQIVIPCAKDKKMSAPSFTLSGNPIDFVANPKPKTNERRPWDPIIQGNPRTWVHCVADYNNNGLRLNQSDTQAGVGINGHGPLWCAGTLYKPVTNLTVYGQLIQALGFANVFILSAGWGLIRSDVRIPPYDVTFSKNNRVSSRAKIKVSARCRNRYLLDQPSNAGCKIFVGKQYAVFLNHIWQSRPTPQIRQCKMRTNWYYAAAIQSVQGYGPVASNNTCSCGCSFVIPNQNCNNIAARPCGQAIRVI